MSERMQLSHLPMYRIKLDAVAEHAISIIFEYMCWARAIAAQRNAYNTHTTNNREYLKYWLFVNKSQIMNFIWSVSRNKRFFISENIIMPYKI